LPLEANMTSSPRLLSVNVGTPRTIEWRGQTIATSIFKSPVAGRVAVKGVNAAGDDQADRRVHGGPDMALYAYATEDYAWWEAQRGRLLGPGYFGDNLTTRGLDVGGAVVGERWQIGSARFEVAAPRIPCYKLAMRMDDPAFVKTFARALRPGAYLRIVDEGDVAAGDAIAVVARPARSVTIARFAEIYLGGGKDAAELLALEALPQSWREWAQEKLAANTAVNRSPLRSA
jgi:MOSC domain-containing protein YiiM